MLFEQPPPMRGFDGTYPPHWNLERVVGTALVDPQFLDRLLRSPASATAEFGLTAEEVDILAAAPATTLEDLAAHIHASLARKPRPRRPAPHRWVWDGLPQARLAV